MSAAPAAILAVVDPEGPPGALQSAAALAERYDARLVAFSCIEGPHDLAALARVARATPEEMRARMIAARTAEVTEIVARDAPGRAAEVHVCHGKSFIETIRYVMHNKIDLVVKTAEPLSGVQRFLFASTDQHLVRKCPCPVWLRMSDGPVLPRRILAAVDVDLEDADEPGTLADLNRRVIETALDLAGPESRVEVLHAWDAVGAGMIWAFSSETDARVAAQTYVDEVHSSRQNALNALLGPIKARLRAEGRPGLDARLVRGPAEEVIAAHAAEIGADVIVMGTVARTGLHGVIIGNTAEDILNSLDCAIVAVKPSTFESPLEV